MSSPTRRGHIKVKVIKRFGDDREIHCVFNPYSDGNNKSVPTQGFFCNVFCVSSRKTGVLSLVLLHPTGAYLECIKNGEAHAKRVRCFLYHHGFRPQSRSLGVRCSHCHVGVEGRPLTEFDFVSDKRPAKQTARLMLQMVRTINENHLTKIDKAGSFPLEVSCVTCHHGVARPQSLADLLTEPVSVPVRTVPSHSIAAFASNTTEVLRTIFARHRSMKCRTICQN